MMKCVTKPAVQVVDLDRLKRHMRIFGDEDPVEPLVDSLETAIAMIDGPDGELGRALINQTWQQSLAVPTAGGGQIELELSPVSSIQSVEYLDGDGEWVEMPVGSCELVEIDDRYFVASNVWPRQAKARVTYVAGYGEAVEDVPAPIRQAITLLAAHFAELPSPVVYGATPVEVPISIDRLLAGFKILWR